MLKGINLALKRSLRDFKLQTNSAAILGWIKRDRLSVALYATEERSPKMKNSNVVRSRLIILINEEINEANWMLATVQN